MDLKPGDAKDDLVNLMMARLDIYISVHLVISLPEHEQLSIIWYLTMHLHLWGCHPVAMR
jgi:hypothetical protein